MQVLSLLLGLIYAFSPCQGQLAEHFNFTLPKAFTRSVINMDELLHLEGDLVLNLEQYVEALSQKANTIRMGIQEMMTRHEQGLESGQEPAWDPFNSYSILRHVQADWMMWLLFMEKPVGQEKLDYLNSKMVEMPQERDFQDAADGLRRIQIVYNMSASDIAKGLLDGVQYNASLTARECLEMAGHLMNQSRCNQAKGWVNAGIKALEWKDPRPEMHELVGTSKTELFVTLARIHVKLNESEAALAAYQTALGDSPDDAKLFQEFRLAETEILTRPVYHDSRLSDKPDKFVMSPCCSGRCKLPRELQLYCQYNTRGSPFLRLAPIKLEILSLHPYIVLFHDVISRKETQRIRTGTKPHLLPSTTYNSDINEYMFESYRTSKSVWLPWDMNNGTVAITKMLEDATALNMNSSEMFQVMNYGLGGLFEIHSDLLLRDEERFYGTTDRIATALIYLSEVQQGGGTIFPFLNLTVFPQRGSVLFWYNLDTRGNADRLTSHAGCPVIVGSKWVMTKWICDEGQEFTKPCKALL